MSGVTLRDSARNWPIDMAPNEPGSRSSASAFSWSVAGVSRPGRSSAACTAAAISADKVRSRDQSASEGSRRISRIAVPFGHASRRPARIAATSASVTPLTPTSGWVTKASGVCA